MDAAHATAIAAVEARRREETEAATKRAKEQREKHEAEIEALERGLSSRGSGCRGRLGVEGAARRDQRRAERDWEDMKRRFDARESRADDIAQIKGLKQEVGVLAQTCANLKIEPTHLALELENRDVTDAVFGNTEGMKKTTTPGPRTRPLTAETRGQHAAPSPNVRARRAATVSSAATISSRNRGSRRRYAPRPQRRGVCVPRRRAGGRRCVSRQGHPGGNAEVLEGVSRIVGEASGDRRGLEPRGAEVLSPQPAPGWDDAILKILGGTQVIKTIESVQWRRYFCTSEKAATDKLGKAISGHGDHLCIDHND